MLNMEAAFLISTKSFTEKQVGTLFLVFGLSQFVCMAPAGYFLDYSNSKIHYVIMAAVLCSALTVLTACTAKEEGANMAGMIVLKILQGGVTAIIPPGFNGVTLGIVGSTGFTHQVSRNRMMNHIGTALVVAISSLVAYFLYPKIGALFLVSPVAALGVFYNLRRIVPTHVDRDAARGLILTSRTMTEYELADDVAIAKQQAVSNLHQDNDDRLSMASSGISSSLLTNSLMTLPENSTITARVRNEHNNQQPSSSPYYQYPSSVGPTPPPSETAAPRRGSLNNSNQHTSYKPPDLLTDNGLSPPSSGVDDDIHNIKNNRSSSTPYPPLPPPSMPPAAKPYRIQSAASSLETFSGIGVNDVPTTADPRLPQPLPQPPTTSSSCDGNDADYESSVEANPSQASRTSYSSIPSFNFGFPGMPTNNNATLPKDGEADSSSNPPSTTKPSQAPPATLRARTPLAVLLNPPLIVFCCIIFFFYLANSAVLPLVMQSLALRDPQAGILLSGLCILIAQACMACFAKLCGDYSPIWGRKNLMLVGLASLTLRCFLLTFLVSSEYTITTTRGSHALKALILSTQFLDSVGAGIIGTLQILVTSDLSGGTGRFSLLLGVTTASMCLGGTISSYLGQVIAYECGYPVAFTSLGIMSLIPFFVYIFFMPETLPDYARPQPKKRQRRLRELLKRLNEQRRKILQSKNNPFRRRKKEDTNNKKSEAAAEEALENHHRRKAEESSGNKPSPRATRHVELV